MAFMMIFSALMESIGRSDLSFDKIYCSDCPHRYVQADNGYLEIFMPYFQNQYDERYAMKKDYQSKRKLVVVQTKW